MSVMVTELYDALRKAGVDEQLARDAARAVLGYEARTDLTTKADIAELRLATKADLAELKADLLKWNVGVMVALTAIFTAVLRLA